MKAVLFSVMLLGAGLVLVPSAAAECVPLLDPDYCEGPISTDPPVRDPRDIECWYYPATHQIRCEW